MARILTQLPTDEYDFGEERPKRTRIVTVIEKWVRYCDEYPGCHAAEPGKPCCGDGHWERISEE